MKVNEVISSGLLESYVLGTATAEENALVLELCSKHPSLNEEMELIEEALINYSSQTVTPLNKDLKNKISLKLFSTADQIQQTTIVPLTDQSKIIRLYKLGIAASVIFFVTSAIYIFSLQDKLNKINTELLKITNSNISIAQQLSTQQTALVVATSKLQILSDPKIKTIGLKGMNSLASISALIHWNTQSEDVYFNAAILPSAPSDKQYQLWAIVDGKPVDMGVIDFFTDTTFQKMRSIKNAQSFAVTIENAGGADSPTMNTMCLLGNV